MTTYWGCCPYLLYYKAHSIMCGWPFQKDSCCRCVYCHFSLWSSEAISENRSAIYWTTWMSPSVYMGCSCVSALSGECRWSFLSSSPGCLSLSQVLNWHQQSCYLLTLSRVMKLNCCWAPRSSQEAASWLRGSLSTGHNHNQWHVGIYNVCCQFTLISFRCECLPAVHL